MAHYSGSANSFDDLRTALVNACAENGWTWEDGILSKGSAYVLPYVSSTTTSSDGPGLVVQGGTGRSGSSLTGASLARPRLGLPGTAGAVPAIAWPVAYDIHAHSNPDEVFCVIRTGVDRYLWLAFGVSDIPGIGGTGLWLAASAYRGYSPSAAACFTIQPDAGQAFQAAQGEVCPALFWTTVGSSSASYISETIHTGISSAGWNARPASISGVDAFHAVAAAAPHIQRTPNAWNQDAPLIPIQGYLWRASSKCSMVVDVRNARYVRITNYEPGEIITLGADRWKIYPFYRKNTTAPNGGALVDHSGTFGWAIRYDGP